MKNKIQNQSWVIIYNWQSHSEHKKIVKQIKKSLKKLCLFRWRNSPFPRFISKECRSTRAKVSWGSSFPVLQSSVRSSRDPRTSSFPVSYLELRPTHFHISQKPFLYPSREPRFPYCTRQEIHPNLSYLEILESYLVPSRDPSLSLIFRDFRELSCILPRDPSFLIQPRDLYYPILPINPSCNVKFYSEIHHF